MTLKKSRVLTPSTEYLINAVSYDHSRQYLPCSVIESGQLYRIIIIFKQVCTLSFKITFNSQKTWYFKELLTTYTQVCMAVCVWLIRFKNSQRAFLLCNYYHNMCPKRLLTSKCYLCNEMLLKSINRNSNIA